MDPSGLDKLSDRQKECLRLVFENYAAKEIARKLEITPNRVNEDLRAARRKLGTNSSMDVARLLVAKERYKRIVPSPLVLETRQDIDETKPAAEPDISAIAARNRSHLEGLSKLVLIVANAFMAVAVLGSVRAILDDLMHFFWDHQIDLSDEPYR